jgi:tetratricopeptide (TPR) repeat protein
MRRLRPGLALWLLVILAPLAGAQDALSAARALYAAAQYDDALAAFDTLKSRGVLAPETALAVEQGRAFCLLALGRQADARAAIEAVVNLDPLYVPGEDDTPPKIRAAFRDARRSALPDVLDHLYSRAKNAYDSKNFIEAAAGFSRILALLDDPDLTLEPGPRSDMRAMAKGFLGLTQTTTLFDAAWKEVTPPVPERTTIDIPRSLGPIGAAATLAIEVILTAQGKVESATVRTPDTSGLAPLVLRAVQAWRYRPAVREGRPVRYRMMVQVVIPPREQ